MSGIDDLAPDQRAVLQLLLKQGKAYVELAALLRIEPDAVRERAVAALDELGPRDGVQLAPERRGEIADYLLGQQSASERQKTRELLEGSAAGRAWARVVAGELRPTTGAQAKVDKQINLKPRTGSPSKALGVLLFISQGTTKLIAVRAQGLRPTTTHRFYAVWLTGDNVAPKPLGFAPAVPASGQNKG